MILNPSSAAQDLIPNERLDDLGCQEQLLRWHPITTGPMEGTF